MQLLQNSKTTKKSTDFSYFSSFCSNRGSSAKKWSIAGSLSDALDQSTTSSLWSCCTPRNTASRCTALAAACKGQHGPTRERLRHLLTQQPFFFPLLTYEIVLNCQSYMHEGKPEKKISSDFLPIWQRPNCRLFWNFAYTKWVSHETPALQTGVFPEEHKKLMNQVVSYSHTLQTVNFVQYAHTEMGKKPHSW